MQYSRLFKRLLSVSDLAICVLFCARFAGVGFWGLAWRVLHAFGGGFATISIFIQGGDKAGTVIVSFFVFYSFRRASTGFACADLSVCAHTVSIAMPSVNAPVKAKIPIPRSIR